MSLPRQSVRVSVASLKATIGADEAAVTNAQVQLSYCYIKSPINGRIGTLLVGSVQLTPIRIGTVPALLLGPLTVEPPFRERGIGQALIERALAEARTRGHRIVVLVGNETYYAKSGFKRIPKGAATMPGPLDPARLLVAELVENAFAGVSGAIQPDWDAKP